MNWVPALGVKKTRMMGQPCRERSLTISLAFWIQYTNVTDGRIPGDSKDRAYAQRRAVKTIPCLNGGGGMRLGDSWMICVTR